MLRWIFDPIPWSGAIQGGVAAALALKVDMDLDTLVREVLQNSYDQRVDGPVHVRFTFHRLDGDARAGFLRAIGWDDLRAHVEGAVGTGRANPMGRRLSQGLELLRGTTLTLLRIDDSGTRGLVGGEDEDGKNFKALCRNVLDTAENLPRRGGSYGLGKSVLWRFSAISTVLFSSRLAEKDPGGGFRLFGRADLPYHEARAGKWNGPGWYGQEERRIDGGRRAVSVWDEMAETVASQAYLLRPAQLGAGTTALVVGFLEPGAEEQRQLEDVANEVLRSATRWFWPSIEPGKLIVEAEVRHNNGRGHSGRAGITDEVRPFVEALKATGTVPVLSEAGDVAERTLKMLVPCRRPTETDPGGAQVEASLLLRVRKAQEQSTFEKNTVALMRGAGMVVEYRKPSRSPLNGGPYHAVLQAGEARGDTRADRALDEFLRAAEPPTHNRWIPGTERIETEYLRGAKARLEGLWRDLDGAVVQACEGAATVSLDGPSALARYFPLTGDDSDGPPPQADFRVDQLYGHWDGISWRFSGRVTRRGGRNAPWSFEVSFWLDAETGRGEEIAVTGLEASAGQVRSREKRWRCVVPADVSAVTFRGRSATGQERMNGQVLRRTRVRLEVRSQVEGVG